MDQRVTILHISDTQFGAYHRFGDGVESLASRLLLDLAALGSSNTPTPDVLVLSGDITEWARPAEFSAALSFVRSLQRSLGIGNNRTMIVPGNHDINRDLTQAYFLQCSGTGIAPSPPYFAKWTPYVDFINEFEGRTSFTPEQPYSIKALPEQKIVFCLLNSTIRESHLPEDHYGWCGETQLRWFQSHLQNNYRGYLRIAVLHHNVRAQGGVIDEERLRDDNDFVQILAPHVDLVLHGHTHDGKSDLLPDGTLILATGSAAVTTEWRPEEVGNQYQLLQVNNESVTRWTRVYDPRAKRWIADTRPSADGATWREKFSLTPGAARTIIQKKGAGKALGANTYNRKSNSLLNDLRMVTLLDHDRNCLVEKRSITHPPNGLRIDYLVVAAGTELYAIGASDEPLTEESIEVFDQAVHQPFRQRSSTARSVLVHVGPADPELKAAASRRGIDIKSWTEYQHLLDLTAYTTELGDTLRRDPLYPQQLYLDQRYRDVDRFARIGSQVKTDLARELENLLLDDDQRFCLVLGHAGYGKSFLLRRVALRLIEGSSGIVPILVRLRELERSHSLAEMVSQTVTASGSAFQLDRFQHMFNSGRVVLLADGYDEFAARVGYQRAADQLDTFVHSVQGSAKVVLTTRPSHFRSRNQATAKIFEDVVSHTRHRIFELEPFEKDEQRLFLARWFQLIEHSEPEASAERWMAALDSVSNLPELARTPRMLSFIARDLAIEDIEAAGRQGEYMTAASLYDRLLTQWLSTESSIQSPGVGLTPYDRRKVAESLAYRLWTSGSIHIDEALLEETLIEALDLPSTGLTRAEAAHDIGTRGMLVGDHAERRFVHQSVFEYLLACRLSEEIGRDAGKLLGAAQLSELTARFLIDLNPSGVEVWVRTLAAGDEP